MRVVGVWGMNSECVCRTPASSQVTGLSDPVFSAPALASFPLQIVMGLELSPPVTFQLRAGSGPVFLSGQECYGESELGPGEGLRAQCPAQSQGHNRYLNT